MNAKNIFSNKIVSVFAAIFVCALWGSLFPFVKIGYSAFHIGTNNIPAIILFAGVRFAISGIILLIMICSVEKKVDLPHRTEILPIVLIALTSVVLHYFFTYMALSFGEGSKSAIVKQVGFLFLSCFAFLIVKDDKFSIVKLLAGILGFLGIIVTNFDGGKFTFAYGDVLLILASFCSVTSTILIKKTVNNMHPIQLVAWSQLFGGLILYLTGVLLGGQISYVDGKCVFVLCYICLASIAAYSVWNILIKYNDLSKLSVIKFTEPLFAVIFSGILLGEKILRLNYFVALVIIFAAILLSNIRDLQSE